MSKAKSDLGRGSPDLWPDEWANYLPKFMEMFNTSRLEMAKIDVHIADVNEIQRVVKETHAQVEDRARALETTVEEAECLNDTATDLRRDAWQVQFRERLRALRNNKFYVVIFIIVLIVVVILIIKLITAFR